jgi:hypothetical protein
MDERFWGTDPAGQVEKEITVARADDPAITR